MKKIISALLILFFVLSFSSCASGKSIPIEVVKKANLTGAILSGDTEAYSETVTFYKNGEKISYSYYIENAENAAMYSYNVTEKTGNYMLYAHEGDIYTIEPGKFSAVLFADQSLTYYRFIRDYLNDTTETKFQLDKGDRFQRKSSTDGEFIYVTYYANVTPQIASEIYSVDLIPGDKIISEYKLDKSYRIHSTEYTIEHQDGTSEKVAARNYLYLDQKTGPLSSIPHDDEKTVTLIINGNTYEYSVPSGVYVTFEDGGRGYEYYIDPELTQKYEVTLADDMTVYATTNFN